MDYIISDPIVKRIFQLEDINPMISKSFSPLLGLIKNSKMIPGLKVVYSKTQILVFKTKNA